MDIRQKINWKVLLICIAIPVGAGLLSALINIGAFSAYKDMNKPPLSPPPVVFPIAWTILYLLMGISCYMIAVSGNTAQEPKSDALFTYFIQLFVNITWPILFFNLQSFLLAFVWLLFLWVLVLRMIIQFRRVNPAAACLQIPYLMWCSFAAYLNLGVYLLNT